MDKKKIFFYLFLIASLNELLSLGAGWPIHVFIKPILLLLLTGHYLTMTTNRVMIFIRALFFCWVGDILLIFEDHNEMFFMMGLLAFLVGHILFIVTFRKLVWAENGPTLPTQKIRYAFPIVLAGTGLVAILYENLGDMKIPVVIYSIAIMMMAISALLRLGRTNKSSFTFVFSGALFFMLSDSILAWNKFNGQIYFASVWIMLTYLLAQYLIVAGILKHE